MSGEKIPQQSKSFFFITLFILCMHVEGGMCGGQKSVLSFHPICSRE